MKSLEDTKARWKRLYASLKDVPELREAMKVLGDDSPCSYGFRSICWKACLLFGSSAEQPCWSWTLINSRTAYIALREHYLRFIEHPDELHSTLDPLADDEESPWIVLRQDEELRSEIMQDVERCMPDNHFFREPQNQVIMVNILFIYCKINMDVGYRQGMHELLAPLLWVISNDAVDPQTIKETDKDDFLSGLLSADFIEHDAYILFSMIMQTAKPSYELGQSSEVADLAMKARASPASDSPIVVRSKHIHEEVLMQVDPELANHLTEIEILPQIFLIRRIRLLFGREFAFDDLLELWDALFAEGLCIEIVDLVCVSMLLRVRWQLMEADYSTALALLLQYPKPSGPHPAVSFVEDATYLRDHLNTDGGAFIITKHSGKAPFEASNKSYQEAKVSSNQVKSGNSTLAKPSRILSGTRSPIRPGASVEGILQGAAQGVFNRGEKWGLNKVVRDAVVEVKRNVQGLQVGNLTPKGRRDGPRWSLDEGKFLDSKAEENLEKVKALLKRNEELSKLIGSTADELRLSLKGDGSDVPSDAVVLALAKLNVLKIYLEDSTVPFNGTEKDPIQASPKPKRSQSISASPEKPTKIVETRSTQPASNEENVEAVPVLTAAAPAVQEKPSSPVVRPRYTLAQSSFSWMLGDDERPSSGFVSSSISAPRQSNAANGKSALLFGQPTDTEDTRLSKKGAESKDNSFDMGNLDGFSRSRS